MYQVAPAQMRVVDAADWHFTAGGAVIRVPYGYSDEETLAAMIHELVEAFLVQQAGITEASVDAWDAAHENISDDQALSKQSQRRPMSTLSRSATFVDADGKLRSRSGLVVQSVCRNPLKPAVIATDPVTAPCTGNRRASKRLRGKL